MAGVFKIKMVKLFFFVTKYDLRMAIAVVAITIPNRKTGRPNGSTQLVLFEIEDSRQKMDGLQPFLQLTTKPNHFNQSQTIY
ncbi:MAG: hypothetical protein R2830_25040 [Saprospiraceae bacterium]